MRRRRRRARVLEKVNHFFLPEFVNRLDEILIFNALTTADMHRIAAIQLESLSANLREKGIALTADKAATEALTKEGYDPRFGARALKRAIRLAHRKPPRQNDSPRRSPPRRSRPV